MSTLRNKYNQLKEMHGNEAVLALVSWLGLADQSGNRDYQELRETLLSLLGQRELDKWIDGRTHLTDGAIEDAIGMKAMIEIMADAPMAE